MSRIRRRSSFIDRVPAAAEIFEPRTLLSAARIAKAATPKPPVLNFSANVKGTLDAPAFSINKVVAGTVSVTKSTLAIGSTFNARLSIPYVDRYVINQVQATISMKISSIAGTGSVKTITLSTPGKKDALTADYYLNGWKKASLKPKAGSTFTFQIDTSTNTVLSISGTYVVPGIPGFFETTDAPFTFTATPPVVT